MALSEIPTEKARLIAQPEMIKTAVEEMLRYESSNQLGNRMTVEQVALGGLTLPAGTPITLCIGAANRDPAQFPDPERFDIGRTPNRHLAFATGAHQCAGMALARLEGAIAISHFLARFPNYALNGEPVRGGRVRFRGFLSVPCVTNDVMVRQTAACPPFPTDRVMVGAAQERLCPPGYWSHHRLVPLDAGLQHLIHRLRPPVVRKDLDLGIAGIALRLDGGAEPI